MIRQKNSPQKKEKKKRKEEEEEAVPKARDLINIDIDNI